MPLKKSACFHSYFLRKLQHVANAAVAPLAAAAPRGIKNVANNCYISALIQLLKIPCCAHGPQVCSNPPRVPPPKGAPRDIGPIATASGFPTKARPPPKPTRPAPSPPKAASEPATAPKAEPATEGRQGRGQWTRKMTPATPKSERGRESTKTRYVKWCEKPDTTANSMEVIDFAKAIPPSPWWWYPESLHSKEKNMIRSVHKPWWLYAGFLK